MTVSATQRVHLAYGRTGLEVDVPADAHVVRPSHPAPLTDPAGALRAALREPVTGLSLRDRVAAKVRPGLRIAVSVCDLTRPQPREVMVRALLAELDGIVDRSAFTLLVATGTHRGNNDSELREMFGDEIVDTVDIVNHDGRDRESLVWCGRLGADVPVWLNRRWVDADVRITTGFVEPHFFAGFSGGPKLVAPGLAGLETVLTLHDARRIGDARATWAVCEGNPVHDDVRAIAAATGVDFSLDVVLDDAHHIVAAFGGDVLEMHATAREYVRAVAMQAVPHEFDIVVTSNSGYPLDQNLYQAVKGISAAATVVRPGGLIVAAAECSDGLPEYGRFREVLGWAQDAAGLRRAIAARERTVADQWQAQVLARVLGRARVQLYSAVLSVDDVRAAHLEAVDDVSTAVAAEVDRIRSSEQRTATVCVLPEGPQTIAYVSDVSDGSDVSDVSDARHAGL